MPDWLVAGGLCFTHGGARPLLDNISLRIASERIALVGPNGSGKSTLLRLLSGSLHAERGSVSRRGRLFHWPQHPRGGKRVGSLLPDAGAGRAAALARHGLPADLAPDLPLACLSGGQVARLRLAAIAVTQPHLLILDEPGNDLDAAGQVLLSDLVAGWRGGLLLVSHDRRLLALADRILELTPGGLTSHGGGLAGFLATRAAQRQAAERALADATRQVRQARSAAREAEARASRRSRGGRQEAARGANAPILMGLRRDRAEKAGSARRIKAERQTAAAAQALDAARERQERPPAPLDMAIAPTGLPPGRMLLRVEGLSLVRAGRRLWQDLYFDLTGPIRLAVTGHNGAGKSSLLACLTGTLDPDDGCIIRAADLRLACLDQRLGSGESGTPLSLVRSRHPDRPEGDMRAALARFGFRGAASEQPLEHLSGGWRVRAHLCAALGGPRPPNLLLLDEPTNHLDMEGMEALRDALLAYDGALVLVCHDADFRRSAGITREIALDAVTR
ncbi:ATP-binding cassette domain-containing protein [Niveispirillum fermenti]|uniref:ATP-binding cassette domain-containing protein n=1 Tax=Niveispirillum fermenti TaxID=1233113 RepID=UPI003A8C2333